MHPARHTDTRHTARTVLPRAAASALLLSLPSGVAACGVCTYAVMWNAMPPVVSWCIVGSVWFVALSWVKWATDVPLKWISGPIASVILVLVAWMGGMMVIGPFLSLAFLPCCIVGSLAVLMAPAEDPDRRRSRRLVMMVGAVAVPVLLISSAVATYRAAQMSPADIIVMWNGTSLERSLMSRLKKDEPASAGEYRKVVAAGPSYPASQAVGRLGEIGDAATDIPLLLDAMKRAEACKEMYLKPSMEEEIRKAVGKLGKLDIVATGTATAAQMSAAWAAKQAGTTTSPAAR
jgi:hypothetical protein